MAKRERNKRSARKARQAERQRVDAARAVSQANQPQNTSKSLFKRSDKGAVKKKQPVVARSERKGIQKVTGYFADVRAEMRQVTWPSQSELRTYSIAVIGSLIFFGFVTWLIDTGFVALLVQYTGLRG